MYWPLRIITLHAYSPLTVTLGSRACGNSSGLLGDKGRKNTGKGDKNNKEPQKMRGDENSRKEIRGKTRNKLRTEKETKNKNDKRKRNGKQKKYKERGTLSIIRQTTPKYTKPRGVQYVLKKQAQLHNKAQVTELETFFSFVALYFCFLEVHRRS